ncbi:hypothetical protein F5X68DRAFT_206968 [Plectosphaerella plurivora]|uniref:Uncharacterized protein n=1 Tax=Plectosphaerella plurivora TaxID=936078 RepID=A0A9P9A8H2_9PEZI|nr:hypothetical protein F5X68DRAFT_206968 [Plectosphaerella plurivora]
MASNPWPTGQPIDWAALQAFAVEQQRLEHAGTPSTLTAAQRAAIYTLIPPPATQQAGAVVDDKINYIGHLNQYLQKHHPSSTLHFSEEGFTIPKPTGAGFDLVWHCKCVIPDPQTHEPTSFPLAVDGQPPATFLRKQQARQYAAYSASAHLYLSGALAMPAGAKVPDAPAAVAAPAPQISQSATGAQQIPGLGQQASKPAPTTTPQPSTPTPAPNPALQVLIASKDRKEAMTKVLTLARELKLPPPNYSFSQDLDGTWMASCDFQHPTFPDNLGPVRGASSAAAAQKQAADQVCQWLETEKARREELLQPYMS